MRILNSLPPFIVILFLLANTACDSSRQKSETVADTTTVVTENEDLYKRPNYSNAKVLETVFATNRDGLEAKEQANENSKTLVSYDYGSALEVIEINDQWLGIRAMVTKVHQNGQSNNWEKVYVPKSSTGSIADISLVQEDLNMIDYLKDSNKEQYFEKGKQLTSHLEIELIDKALFESKKPTAVNFLLQDTTAVIKVDGTIELKCTQKNKYYRDINTDNDGMEHYAYVGQIGFLNQYLIAGRYWEASDFKLVDKTSGEQTQSLLAYPHISPDQKHIICLSCNPYESTTDMELYSISGHETKLLMSTSFTKWLQGYNKGDIFWSNDGYLYVTASHMAVLARSDSDQNEKQYLRIKVL